MSYHGELSFICDVLKKTHVNAGVLRPTAVDAAALKRAVGAVLGEADFLVELLGKMSERTVYRYTDAFECCYRFLLLPNAQEEASVLYVGPYLSAPLSEQQVLELGEKNHISPQKHRYLSEYYAGLTVLGEDSPIFTMLHSFYERLWGSSGFSWQDVSDMWALSHSETPFSRSMLMLEANDALVNMRAIERRYEFENEMIRAVSLGQAHLEKQFRQAFSERVFEKRAADPLRNAKNYGIIMNTLLRKAAESGGVHPLYLDRVSSEFAAKIENLGSLSENAPLMVDMYRTYCRLVKKHSLKEFSALVQGTILMIESNLSTDLSPRVLAAGQGVSLGYLCTVFKRETGETVSAYTRARRMEYAEYLLGKSNLQIQNVALHCGIMDVQYFTKLFKRHFGMTPSEYRKTVRRNG